MANMYDSSTQTQHKISINLTESTELEAKIKNSSRKFERESASIIKGIS